MLSTPTPWKAWCSKFSEGTTRPSQLITHRIWKTFSPTCWSKTQLEDPVCAKSWKKTSLVNVFQNYWRPQSPRMNLHPLSSTGIWLCLQVSKEKKRKSSVMIFLQKGYRKRVIKFKLANRSWQLSKVQAILKRSGLQELDQQQAGKLSLQSVANPAYHRPFRAKWPNSSQPLALLKANNNSSEFLARVKSTIPNKARTLVSQITSKTIRALVSILQATPKSAPSHRHNLLSKYRANRKAPQTPKTSTISI